MLATYLTFCGIGIHNAQIFEAYSKEYERNKALLEVVHDLFTEQTSVENVVVKIMQRAQTLLKCERCSLLLKDKDSSSELASNALTLVHHGVTMESGNLINSVTHVSS
ncbi:hypothetical protein RRG08_038008 [Elysia crispata]|uniref:Uncharacterized protein n=1 Tax=Elysia crispata TaxID=231223 RepID=A0AAE1B5D4_9GAST|nr:hypothetical protein RRG08_038008 [Elysia crispata]